MPPAAGFGLPILNAGWKYEAWVVIDGVGPISMGHFRNSIRKMILIFLVVL